MKLSEWAQREGIPLRTAQRRFRDGSLPVPTFVTKTGRLMVIVDEPDPSTLTPAEMLDVIFDLKRQLNRIERKLARKDGASD